MSEVHVIITIVFIVAFPPYTLMERVTRYIFDRRGYEKVFVTNVTSVMLDTSITISVTVQVMTLSHLYCVYFVYYRRALSIVNATIVEL